jgi:hypothetical protein
MFIPHAGSVNLTPSPGGTIGTRGRYLKNE